jgi:hypothetical protein
LVPNGFPEAKASAHGRCRDSPAFNWQSAHWLLALETSALAKPVKVNGPKSTAMALVDKVMLNPMALNTNEKLKGE